MTFKIVMLRHGESEWNEKNLFCGWYNANLSEKGKQEAVNSGRALREAGYKFDLSYTSALKRAQETLNVILEETRQTNIPVIKTWRLNEKHYGALTGMNKVECVAKYGEQQVAVWRRSFDVPPPPMEPDHPYYDAIINDPIYADGPSQSEFPKFESLELTTERALPFWKDEIVPRLKENKKILIVAHGTSLRGIVKYLDQLSNDEIMKLNLPNGIPFVYTLDDNLKPTQDGSLQFLSDPETVKKAMEAVANQTKAK